MQSLNTISKTNKRFQTRSNIELLFVTTDLSSVTGSAMKRLLELSHRRVSPFSRGVIFTRARVSLALLSLGKIGDYS